MSDFREMLKRDLRVSERELQALIATAPKRYKVYTIPKRSGGQRVIAHPAFELKVAQRVLISNLLQHLPVHPNATAYKTGSSVRLNAYRHVHNRPILKYDLENFFPSITEQAWLSYCEKHEVLDRDDAIASARLLFRREKGSTVLRLSIGAPSSPVLSNVLMNEFDREVSRRTAEHKITYTRYADDMTFSAERTWNLREVDPILRSVISNLSAPELTINERKTTFTTMKYRRQITGVILTPDKRLSLGRERKRLIRAMLHHFITDRLNLRDKAVAAGMLAFAQDVEPEFYVRMELAYGADSLVLLKKEAALYRRPERTQRVI